MSDQAKETIKQLKAKLTALKRTRRFIRWGESAGLARELRDLLCEIEEGVDDPRIGVDLLASFYTTDRSVFERCDDSSGHVGDVYCYEAREMFISFAGCCPDKKWLTNLVLKTSLQDDYGVRDVLINSVKAYLPEVQIRDLVARFQDRADQEQDEYQCRHFLGLVESLARQLGDAVLFEKTRLAAWGDPSTSACVNIAQVYLECGDEQTALGWLERIPQQEAYHARERDQLLLEIYNRLGDEEGRAKVAWRSFRSARSATTLKQLLTVVGDDQKESLLAEEVTSILANKSLSLVDAAFLIEIEDWDAAATYLLDRVDQLNGDFYSHLLPLAEPLETVGRSLAASILYRALLDSILRRAQPRTYSHGARYLRKLDLLAKCVDDWRSVEPHSIYLEHLRQKHGRKTSFWDRYDK